MSNPREAIETAMETALRGITTSAYPTVPRSVGLVTRRGVMLAEALATHSVVFVLLTEENRTENRGLSGVKDTTLTVGVGVYLRLEGSEEPARVLNAYTEAIKDVLEANRFWGGLAVTTTVEGVAQHEIMEAMLPEAKSIVAALVQYIWARDAA